MVHISWCLSSNNKLELIPRETTDVRAVCPHNSATIYLQFDCIIVLNLKLNEGRKMSTSRPVPNLLRAVAILLSVFFFAAASVDAEGFCFKCLFKCPKSDAYDPACLRSAIPPWPICLFHSVDDFVDHAQDSATRCCGDDISACRCPKKNTDKFLNDIGEWCRGVASCGPVEENTGDVGDGSEEVKVE